MATIRVSRLVAEILVGGSRPARVTHVAAEVLIPTITRSPATPTGAGVSKVAAEVLIGGAPRAAVSTVKLEVLLADTTPAPGSGGGGAPGGDGGVRVFGYAG